VGEYQEEEPKDQEPIEGSMSASSMS